MSATFKWNDRVRVVLPTHHLYGEHGRIVRPTRSGNAAWVRFANRRGSRVVAACDLELLS
jgi:hypothetical protein